MVSFDYLIHDEMGLHARPVGLVVKAVKPYKDTVITIAHGDKTADAKRMFAIMALQVKQNETITVTVDGENEQEIADAIRGIFEAEKL
ncbi:MAG: HPr family phosphocarrier protein [Oscillospiraceae bacterium]|nr:HPr family phosphocarrier protein [Oscillospiraceae bacterium]